MQLIPGKDTGYVIVAIRPCGCVAMIAVEQFLDIDMDRDLVKMHTTGYRLYRILRGSRKAEALFDKESGFSECEKHAAANLRKPGSNVAIGKANAYVLGQVFLKMHGGNVAGFTTCAKRNYIREFSNGMSHIYRTKSGALKLCVSA